MAENKIKNRYWINPCDCGCDCDEAIEDVYRLTYELPGIKKEDIDLKVTKRSLRLIAKRDDVEYYNEFPFTCDADEESVQAVYENGLLNIEIPLNCPNPFKEAKTVKIS
jgi:HSP20 family protein